MFNFGKRLLTAMLSAAVILPALAVPTAVTAAENGADAGVTYEEAEDTSGSSKDGQYSTDDVAGDLLVPHTGKSSELEYSPAEEVVSEASDDCFISLSSSSELYDSLGFNSAQMKQEMRDMAKDPAYQNPLSGYTFVDPNELLVGSVNRSENHGVLFETWDNESKSSAAELPNLEQLAKNTNDFTMNEDEDNQTHNGIGIDVDGDGIEELAYYSLYYNDDSNSGNIGSSCWIDILKRVPDGNSFKWQKVHSFHTYMQSGDYVLDIEAAESKGYVSLAAGDYDGDGKEELAYYMPDKKNSEDANDARVVVMNIDVNNGSYSHSELGSLHVKDFTSDYGHMGRGWRLPTVALSTTSTRLGNVKNASVGAKQYETHDDLVMTVSVPTEYRDDDLYLNSITKIFTFEGGSAQKLFQYEYLPFDNNTKRMNYPNTCDADLNGDGFKELVVAGMMEKEMNKPSGANDTNRNWDEFAIHKGHSYATCVMDLEQGDVLWVGKGRAMKDFEKFFEDMPSDSLSAVIAVAMDMNASYNKLVTKHLPKAQIVYDRFHMQSQFGRDVLGVVRLNEARKHKAKAKEILADIPEDTDKETIKSLKQEAKVEKQEYSQLKKKLRWSLLTNSDKLSDSKPEQLQSILQDHHDLAVCYAMKEEMCRLYELTDYQQAVTSWTKWFQAAKESEIPALVKFALQKEKRLPG